MPTWNSASHQWEQAGDAFAFVRPLGNPSAPSAADLAALTDLDAHAAPRRLLLLVEGGKPVVLALPPASRLHAELVRQMALHPGQRIAGEYLAPRGWVRFLEGGAT